MNRNWSDFLFLLFLSNCVARENNKLCQAFVPRGNSQSLGPLKGTVVILTFVQNGLLVALQPFRWDWIAISIAATYDLWQIQKEIRRSCLIWWNSQEITCVLIAEPQVSRPTQYFVIFCAGDGRIFSKRVWFLSDLQHIKGTFFTFCTWGSVSRYFLCMFLLIVCTGHATFTSSNRM